VTGLLSVQATSVLANDIHALIHAARTNLASTVNAGLTLLYWRLGNRIRNEVLGGERGNYGEQVVKSLALSLEAEHGQGFGVKNLRNMLRFAEEFETEAIVYAVRRQLSWTKQASMSQNI
jgi:DUF1016 N-terminal domain